MDLPGSDEIPFPGLLVVGEGPFPLVLKGGLIYSRKTGALLHGKVIENQSGSAGCVLLALVTAHPSPRLRMASDTEKAPGTRCQDEALSSCPLAQAPGHAGLGGIPSPSFMEVHPQLQMICWLAHNTPGGVDSVNKNPEAERTPNSYAPLPRDTSPPLHPGHEALRQHVLSVPWVSPWHLQLGSWLCQLYWSVGDGHTGKGFESLMHDSTQDADTARDENTAARMQILQRVAHSTQDADTALEEHTPAGMQILH
ncbi:hypothetical protein P7K49_014253 [Saguinus oedipus]|uniref:Uncharacterized protein n=1 Tax=Saguinus oedipus TaxID=9490 RepID=A0ABQ9VKI0_SAGOE|nr:hypothetical protein P7K49_014253 [Saguinus oedipus]